MTEQPESTPAETLESHFWKAACAGRIELQRCPACRQLRYFPAPVCPSCLGADGVWEALSGRGSLHALTTIERAPSAGYASEVPYTVAMIDLVEGPRVMARLDIDPAQRLPADTEVIFDGVGDSAWGRWLRFRVASAAMGT